MISMAQGPGRRAGGPAGRFHPEGRTNGGNRDGQFGLMPVPEYVARANDETFVGISWSRRRAIEAVSEIALPDVDLCSSGRPT